MKPIFNTEKIFIEERLGIKLPDGCWRKGKGIYLNADEDTKILTLKVEKSKLYIKKDTIEKVLAKYKNKTWQEEIDENTERLDMLFNESVMMTKEFIQANPNHELRPSLVLAILYLMHLSIECFLK